MRRPRGPSREPVPYRYDAKVLQTIPKEFLDDEGVFYEEIDIEESVEAALLVEKVNKGKRIVPTFDVDGTVFSLKPFDWKKLQAELERLGIEEDD